MKDFLAQAIADAADENNLDVEFRPDYSGLGMHGKTTAAVTGDLSDILAAMLYVNLDDIPGDRYDIEHEIDGGFRLDSMGRDTIVY